MNRRFTERRHPAEVLAAWVLLVACTPSGIADPGHGHRASQSSGADAAGTSSAANVTASASPSAVVTQPTPLGAARCLSEGALKAEINDWQLDFDVIGYTDSSLFALSYRGGLPEVQILKDGRWERRPELTPRVAATTTVDSLFFDRGEFRWEGRDCPQHVCELERRVSGRFRAGKWESTWSHAWGTPQFPHLQAENRNADGEVVSPFAWSKTGEILAFAQRGWPVLVRSTREPAIPQMPPGCQDSLRFERRLTHSDEENAWAIATACSKQFLVQWNATFDKAEAFELPILLNRMWLKPADKFVRISGEGPRPERAFHLLTFNGRGFFDVTLPFAGPLRAGGVLAGFPIVIEGALPPKHDGDWKVSTVDVIHRVHGPGSIQSVPMPGFKAVFVDKEGGLWTSQPENASTLCYLGPKSNAPVRVELPDSFSGKPIIVKNTYWFLDRTLLIFAYVDEPKGPHSKVLLKVEAP